MPDDAKPITLSAKQAAALRTILLSSDPGWFTMFENPPPRIDLDQAEWDFLARTFWPD